LNGGKSGAVRPTGQKLQRRSFVPLKKKKNKKNKNSKKKKPKLKRKKIPKKKKKKGKRKKRSREHGHREKRGLKREGSPPRGPNRIGRRSGLSPKGEKEKFNVS